MTFFYSHSYPFTTPSYPQERGEGHLEGHTLTMKQAILADGQKDYETPEYPLYGFMPYRKGKAKAARTEKQMEASRKLGLLSSKTRQGLLEFRP